MVSAVSTARADKNSLFIVKYLMIMRVTKVTQTTDTTKEDMLFFVVKGI